MPLPRDRCTSRATPPADSRTAVDRAAITAEGSWRTADPSRAGAGDRRRAGCAGSAADGVVRLGGRTVRVAAHGRALRHVRVSRRLAGGLEALASCAPTHD